MRQAKELFQTEYYYTYLYALQVQSLLEINSIMFREIPVSSVRSSSPATLSTKGKHTYDTDEVILFTKQKQ